jgi:hypothetical protein
MLTSRQKSIVGRIKIKRRKIFSFKKTWPIRSKYPAMNKKFRPLKGLMATVTARSNPKKERIDRESLGGECRSIIDRSTVV